MRQPPGDSFFLVAPSTPPGRDLRDPGRADRLAVERRPSSSHGATGDGGSSAGASDDRTAVRATGESGRSGARRTLSDCLGGRRRVLGEAPVKAIAGNRRSVSPNTGLVKSGTTGRGVRCPPDAGPVALLVAEQDLAGRTFFAGGRVERRSAAGSAAEALPGAHIVVEQETSGHEVLSGTRPLGELVPGKAADTGSALVVNGGIRFRVRHCPDPPPRTLPGRGARPPECEGATLCYRRCEVAAGRPV